MKRETINAIAEISKTAFGFLMVMNYIFATEHRSLAIVVPFVLWMISIVVYKKTNK